MNYQSVFKRYELKYIISEDERAELFDSIKDKITCDKYPSSTVRNIYFDTDSFRLIRRSIDKPTYKEKLRIRSYSQIQSDGCVFVEIKKKYKSVVYKRRVVMREGDAIEWLTGEEIRDGSQIEREVSYFKNFYSPLSPKLFLSYDREAYCSRLDTGVRLTVDRNILARRDRLSLTEEVGGVPLLESGLCLMEIKCPGAMPLWLAHRLSEMRIYKTSFSKYGTAYRKYIFNDIKENTNDGIAVSGNF